MDAFVGEIMLFAGAVTPTGWLECDGSLIAISQNQALFALIGVTYGGNGTTNFNLPDLRGRIPVSMGQRPGNNLWPLGSAVGSRTVTLTTAQIPSHNHPMNLSSSLASSPNIGSGVNVLAATAPDLLTYSDSTSPLGAPGNLNPKMVAPAGGGQAHANVMPTLYLRYLICTTGIFPSSN